MDPSHTREPRPTGVTVTVIPLPKVPTPEVIGRDKLAGILETLADRSYANDSARREAANKIASAVQPLEIDDSSIGRLAASLGDRLTEVREATVRTLTALGAQADQHVRHAFQSPNEYVREAACFVVFSRGQQAVTFTRQVMGLLQEDQPRIRTIALETLEKIGKAATLECPSIVRSVEEPIYNPHEDLRVRDVAGRAVKVIDPSWQLDRVRFEPASKAIEERLMRVVRD